MTERTFTEDEVREAFNIAWNSEWSQGREKIEDVMINELYRTKPPVIPEGVLCWGVDHYDKVWVPCVSHGDGTGGDASGDGYDTIRITHPDDWAKAPQWARSRTINRVRDTQWCAFTVAEALADTESYIYAEGRPE